MKIKKSKFYKLLPDGGSGANEGLMWFIANTDVPEEIFDDCDSLEELNSQAKELIGDYRVEWEKVARQAAKELEKAVLKADLEAFCKPYSAQVYLYSDGHVELGYAGEGFEEETRGGEAIEAFSAEAGKDCVCYSYSDEELVGELRERGIEVPENCESVTDYADEEYPEVMEGIRKQLYDDTVSEKEVIREFWEKFIDFLED